MKTYLVTGFLTVTCETLVKAKDEAEAMEIAVTREVAEISGFTSIAEDSWIFYNDGQPDVGYAEELN